MNCFLYTFTIKRKQGTHTVFVWQQRGLWTNSQETALKSVKSSIDRLKKRIRSWIQNSYAYPNGELISSGNILWVKIVLNKKSCIQILIRKRAWLLKKKMFFDAYAPKVLIFWNCSRISILIMSYAAKNSESKVKAHTFKVFRVTYIRWTHRTNIYIYIYM